MSQPTVVLVHGVFADASSFARVVPELLADSVRVLAPAVGEPLTPRSGGRRVAHQALVGHRVRLGSHHQSGVCLTCTDAG
ncbi:hypothetical protein FRAHR75_200023 [Frankia sp. Hr75.2]|nr:hypothetical protein FRAHR75_200023 [Frankia sp. Hr75.2]